MRWQIKDYLGFKEGIMSAAAKTHRKHGRNKTEKVIPLLRITHNILYRHLVNVIDTVESLTCVESSYILASTKECFQMEK